MSSRRHTAKRGGRGGPPAPKYRAVESPRQEIKQEEKYTPHVTSPSAVSGSRDPRRRDPRLPPTNSSPHAAPRDPRLQSIPPRADPRTPSVSSPAPPGPPRSAPPSSSPSSAPSASGRRDPRLLHSRGRVHTEPERSRRTPPATPSDPRLRHLVPVKNEPSPTPTPAPAPVPSFIRPSMPTAAPSPVALWPTEDDPNPHDETPSSSPSSGLGTAMGMRGRESTPSWYTSPTSSAPSTSSIQGPRVAADLVSDLAAASQRRAKQDQRLPSSSSSSSPSLSSLPERAPISTGPRITQFHIPEVSAAQQAAAPPPILDSDPDSLPIARCREEILQSMAEHQVLIISGETGSGKSTQVPKYIWHEAQAHHRPCSIICSQPRRIAATSLARRVSTEMKGELGQLVGYHIGMEPLSSSDTKILFCTTGILVERLVHHRKSLGQLTHIILDEVHERSLDVDLALILLKKLLPRFPHIRLVLMSATLEGQRFDQYFPLIPNTPPHKLPHWRLESISHATPSWGSWGEAQGKAEKRAPVLHVQGRTFPVHVYYMDKIFEVIKPDPRLISDCENALQDVRPSISRYLYELAVQLTIYLDNTNTDNRESESILIFLPGLGEIKHLLELCLEKASLHRLWLIPLHSSIRSEEQSKIFQTKKDHRKVVLSTNIAESSITVPDVRFVIDFGLFKESFFDADTNLASLRMEWCSRANLDQRKGRAGRIRAGLVFRLFHSQLYDDLPQYSKAEILRAPLENLILRIKTYGEPVSMLSLALDPPDLSGVVNSIDNLRDAGALTTIPGDLMKALDHKEDDPSGEITHLGRLYERLPLHFRVSRMLLISHCFGFLEEGLIMAACMSLGSPFEIPIRQTLDGFAQKLDYAGPSSSDSLASLFLYREWKYEKERQGWNSRQQRRWEEQRRVQGTTLMKIEALVLDLAMRLRDNGIQPPAHLLPSETENSVEGETPREDDSLVDLEDQDYSSPSRSYARSREDAWDGRSGREFSSCGRELSREDQLLLAAILYGSFYPNYLQTQFSDPDAWSFACNNMDKLSYDPTRTIEVTHVPERATRSDLRDLFHECGPIDSILLENTHGFVTFKKPPRGRLNLSVVKALKLGKIRQLRIHEDDPWDDYDRRGRRSYGRSTVVRRGDGTLGGPFSPFQVTFLNVASKLRTIVPRDSINATVIDVSFEYVPRYLVSCFMSKSSHNSDTIARETTMLPALPLVAPLLSMIFVPSSHVYFRSNRNHNKYLGVQVGQKLVFDLDAILTARDLEDINQLRTLMNQALSREGIKDPNWAQLRRQLLSLMTRRRKPLKVREAPVGFCWPSAPSEEVQEGKEQVDVFQAQDDFLPFQQESSDEHATPVIFPPIQGIHPPLAEGVDYDSEEELRQSMVSRLEDFERELFDHDESEINRDTPEVVCKECKELISEITNLETCPSPFVQQGHAWRLKDPLGFVFDSKAEDEFLSTKLGQSVSIYNCKANHAVALGVDGSKYLTPESQVEIHGIHNEVIMWKTPAWRDNFAMFARDIRERAPRASHAERLAAYHKYTCPCCEITVYNKKDAFLHMNSNKHKQQKEEMLRKTKYARHSFR